jgi:hypothetical protein
VVEPFTIQFQDVRNLLPDQMKGMLDSESSYPENLIVINTKAAVDDFLSYKTLALITKRTIIFLDDRGELRVYPFQNIDDTMLDKKKVTSFTTKFKPLIGVIIPLSIVLFFVATFLGELTLYGFLLFMYTLAMLVLAKLFHRSLTYVKAYQLGLHILIVPVSALGLLSIYVTILPVSLLRFLIFIGVSIFVLQKFPRGK